MHNVPPDSETHFKLVMACAQFQNLAPVKRHQAVYKVLAQELAGGVHALALHLYSPEEWAQKGSVAPSPDCLGGEKRQ